MIFAYNIYVRVDLFRELDREICFVTLKYLPNTKGKNNFEHCFISKNLLNFLLMVLCKISMLRAIIEHLFVP